MEVKFIQKAAGTTEVRTVFIDRPKPIYKRSKSVVNFGGQFFIEELQEKVLFVCRRDGVVIASEICNNGPSVMVAVDKLVNNSFAIMAAMKKWG
jgi:hypothetical protein